MMGSEYFSDSGSWGVMQGDCRERLLDLPDDSVDLVLIDPPYGTIRGCRNVDSWNEGSRVDWDIQIPPDELLSLCLRLLRKNGKAIIFCQEPLTSRLVTTSLPGISFSSRAIWEKNCPGICLGAAKNLVSYFEDIAIFQKIHPKHDFEGMDPSRPYFAKVQEYIGKSLKDINREMGNRRAEHTFYHGSTQFQLCGKDVYISLSERYGLREMPGFIEWDILNSQSAKYREDLVESMNRDFPSVFNLMEGQKSKSNLFKYPKEVGFHPTQKPVPLLEDLILTYSRSGDLVVDFVMGSASTGVAAMRTDRRFVGIEQDAGIYEEALVRLQKETLP